MFSGEKCGIFKITYFEEHLRTATSIMLLWDDQSKKNLAFAKPIPLLKFLFQSKNLKILKNRESQKKTKNKKTLQFSYTVIMFMFYYKIPWFSQDFNSENMCFLNL